MSNIFVDEKELLLKKVRDLYEIADLSVEIKKVDSLYFQSDKIVNTAND